MEELINIELEKVQTWLNSQAKNDSWNFKMYSVPYINSTLKRDNFRANNFHSTNAEEALEFLAQAMVLYGDTSQKYFLIRHIINDKDAKGKDFYIKNPLFNASSQKGAASLPGIGAISGQQYGQNFGGLLEMERRHNKEVQDLKEQLQEIKYEQHLKELREEIEAVKYENRNAVDKITGFAETPTGQTIVTAIMGLINQKMYGVPEIGAQEQPLQKQPTQAEAEPLSDQQPQPQEASQQIQKINLSIQKLEQIFPGNVSDALLDLAIFCEKNPAQAQAFRNLAKNASNE